MKNRLAFTMLLSAISGLAVAEPAKSMLVPGSQDHDFGVICKINGNVTFFVNGNSKDQEYQVARNIYLTDAGGGRVALSMMRGFVKADEYTTYITATNESCQTFSQ